MLSAPEQKRRIRTHIEGVFGETKEGFVHFMLSIAGRASVVILARGAGAFACSGLSLGRFSGTDQDVGVTPFHARHAFRCTVCGQVRGETGKQLTA